jgi:hypothetical protein
MNLSEVLSVAVLHVGLRLVETFPATDFQAEHGVPSYRPRDEATEPAIERPL